MAGIGNFLLHNTRRSDRGSDMGIVEIHVTGVQVTSHPTDAQVTLDEQIAPIVLDALMGVLQQAIEFPSPSSSDPYSEPICILVPGDAEAILASLLTLKRIQSATPIGTCVAPPCKCDSSNQARCAYWRPMERRIQSEAEPKAILDPSVYDETDQHIARSATMPEPVAYRWRGRVSRAQEWNAWDAGPAHPPYLASENYQIEPLYGPEVLDLLAAEREKNACSDAKELAEGCFRAIHAESRLAAERERRKAAELSERFHDDAANKYAAQVNYWMGKHDETSARLAKVMEALREPTEEMIEAGSKEVTSTGPDACIRPTKRIWKAMSAALIRSVETPS